MATILLAVPQLNGTADQNPGGQITAATGLLQYLREQGHEVLLINTAERSFPPPGPARRLVHALTRLFATFRMLARTRPIGAIVFSSASAGIFEKAAICAIAGGFRIRSVLFLRSTFAGNPRGIKAALLRLALRIPSTLAVQGELARQQLLALGAEESRIARIPNWLPPGVRLASTPRHAVAGQAVHFIFVGWLVQAKGVDEIALAITELQRRKVDFRFSIVGGGTREAWLRTQHEQHGWGSSVQITGWLAPAEVHRLLAEAHVFVLQTFHGEGFPNALLEALAAGLPAISTKMGAIPETLMDGINGFLVEPRDPAALAAAMERYIRTPELVRRHSDAALETVRQRHGRERNCGMVVDLLSISTSDPR